MAEKIVYWLADLGKEHSNLVGKKCANLGELTKACFRIPPGFALTLDAYDTFMNGTGVIDEIRSYLASFSADPSDPKGLVKFTEASKDIRYIVESKKMPAELADMVTQYYEELCQSSGMKDIPVATRSAGPASHPGQYETYLNITGLDNVINNIVKVWASTFNTRSLIARYRKGMSLDYDPIGVCVLKMVNARSAGIMFTAEPGTADTTKCVIEGAWGYGESVVSGGIIPDCWIIDKSRYEIVERRLSPKPEGITGRETQPCLSDDEIITLAKIGEKIEKHFSSPQDIEWAVEGALPPDNLFILQARPEKFRISFAGF